MTDEDRRKANRDRRQLLKREGGRRANDAKISCPSCGHPKSAVVDSRPFVHRDGVFRRRKCAECGKRFTTEEQIAAVFPSGAKRKGSASI